MRNTPYQSRPAPSAQRRGKLFIAALCATALLLGGCSWFQFPGVYRLSIPQGNIVTQEMVDQLKPGMTQRQVRFVLGTPLIQDSFNQNRWDYVYSFRDPRGEITRSRFTVYFDGDELTRFTGDYRPTLPDTAEAEPAEAEEDDGVMDEISGPDIFETN